MAYMNGSGIPSFPVFTVVHQYDTAHLVDPKPGTTLPSPLSSYDSPAWRDQNYWVDAAAAADEILSRVGGVHVIRGVACEYDAHTERVRSAREHRRESARLLRDQRCLEMAGL